MCSRERERERRRRRHGGKRNHEERQREEQSFGATAIASLVTAIALLEQSFGATSFAARFVFASPSGRRRPANEANGAVSPLPLTGALAPLPPTVQFQHAADERTCLEELRQKVLSGEMKTVTYLDTEQKLVLPEIGYQLLHNYADQIQNWGWLCNIRSLGSRSFKKNLNLLHRQLNAVPCIVGVNLTDVDLLEFLQQLADTDGSSTIPPSVHRVLNSKACRGW